MRRGDKAIHCPTFEQFTVARIAGNSVLGGSRAFPIEECQLSTMEAPLDVSTLATLIDLARIVVEDRNPANLAIFSTLTDAHKRQFWAELPNELREGLSNLSASKAA